jgi:Histidine kinase-, DNA gyrase B-, and HSP90-like ATPase
MTAKAARTVVEEDYEDNPPDPVATIESLGALGYSPESALADLIDNSISSGARHVAVTGTWNGRTDSWFAVADDGSGMSEQTLRNALRVGSADPLAPRGLDDLGRFGFGLKTASFSQCRELTVWSQHKGDKAAARCWDLEHVRATKRWEMYRSAPSEAAQIIRKERFDGEGTVVVWRKLINLTDDQVDDDETRRAFYEQLDNIESHLAMTFGRFISRKKDPIVITLNRAPVRAWDPFLQDDPATQKLPPETLAVGSARVKVSAFVLPHESKLDSVELEKAGGPHGWNAQQGFYVYRQDRLIVAGGWLGFRLAQNDDHNLARIAVDIPTSLDKEWHLDVRKMTVRPPTALRNDLMRIAILTRKRSKAVYRSRGGTVHKPTVKKLTPVWKQTKRHGEIRFAINRSHPLVQDAIEKAGDRANELRTLLELIESTIPIPLLPGTRRHEQAESLRDTSTAVLCSVAQLIYDRFITRDRLSRDEARRRLESTEPFDQYPDIIRSLTEVT